MFFIIDSASGISFSKHESKVDADKLARFLSSYHGRRFVVVPEVKQ